MTWIAFKLFLGRAWDKLAGFLKTPIGRWATVGVVVLVAAILYGNARYDAGVTHQKAEYAKLTAKAVQKVAKVEKAGAAISTQVATDLTKRQVEIRYQTQTLVKEVPRYVTVESDRACIVGRGAVLLHDHAFLGLPGLPAGSGGPFAADSGVALSALVANDVEFAGTAYSWKAEALAWRTWYPLQADYWAKNVKASPAP